MAEGQEVPTGVVAPAPKKEFFLTRFTKRLLGRPSQPQPQGEGLVGTRTTEQIRAAAQQIPSTPEKPQERVPAPGEPDYEPLTNESPVPAPEREARLRYAAQQYQAEQKQPPATTTTTQEPKPDTSRPEWQSREDQRLVKGYEKEAIRQAPQTPGTGLPREQAPTTYESPFSTPAPVETQASTPEADTSFAQKVLDTPVEELEKEVPEGAAEALREVGGADTSVPVKEPTPSEEQPIPVQIPQEEEVPT